MAKTKKMVLMALFTALALGLFFLEAQLPSPVPIPGVKLGLANIITLVAMVLLGKKEAGGVLVMRIILGALFAASPSTILYSMAGGALAYAVMLVALDEKRLWVTSALAALAHNAGQMIVCALIVKTPGIAVYLPVLAASGIITGVFTGLAAQYSLPAVRKMAKLQK